MAGVSPTQLLPTMIVYLCRRWSMSSTTVTSGVVFGHHVHRISMLEIFSSGDISEHSLQQ
jgi:hypothetical protein